MALSGVSSLLPDNASVTIKRGPSSGVGALSTIASSVACRFGILNQPPMETIAEFGTGTYYAVRFAAGVNVRVGDRLEGYTPTGLAPTTATPYFEVVRVEAFGDPLTHISALTITKHGV